MNIRNGIGLLLAPAVIGMAGCSAMGETEFSCGGPNPGVTCLPATEVYEITSDPELHKQVKAALEAAAASEEEYDPQEIVRAVRMRYRPSDDFEKPMAEPVTQPLPVLEPAHVVRIWIDAWVDQKGDLHMPGYVFSEITPRRWSIGEPSLSNAEVLAPVQIDRGQTTTNKP